GKIPVDAEFLGRDLRRGRKPFLELAVKIAAGIALTARIDGTRATRGELLVDEARHRLIGRGPIAVAAAEHGVAYPGEGILRQVAAKPFHELRGVVGRRAVIGGADDEDAALLRQLADIIIERPKAGDEAVDLGEIG